MRFFPLIATLTLAATAAAQQPQAPLEAAPVRAYEAMATQQTQPMSQADMRRTPAIEVSGVRHAMPTPDDTPAAIMAQPEGEYSVMVKKGGVSQWYFPPFGEFQQYDEGMVIETVTNGDRFYMKPVWPIASSNCWIEGKIENNEIVFQFPQIADRKEYSDGFVAEQTCIVFGFTPSEEDPTQGWYEATEEQTYRLSILEDGTLQAQDEYAVLGHGYYFTTDEEGNPIDPYWSWQYTGATITTIEPEKNKVAEIPEGVEMQAWNKIEQYSATPMQVGVDGDKMYIVGLMAGTDLADSPVVGTISEDRKTVSFPSQFLGIYKQYTCEAWLVPCDETGMTILPDLVFDYDEENKILKTDGSYCISLRQNSLYWVEFVTSLYICAPDNAPVTKLPTPIVENYWPADPQTGLLPELDFIIPEVQDMNVLPVDKLYYNLILDDEVFEFLPDEYDVAEPMTDIPYTFQCKDIFWMGAGKFFMFIYPEDFDSLGIRSIYKDGDTRIESEIGWAPGYVKVEGIDASAKAVSVEYYNAAGMRIPESAAKGICIQRTVYDNGQVSTVKTVR